MAVRTVRDRFVDAYFERVTLSGEYALSNEKYVQASIPLNSDEQGALWTLINQIADRAAKEMAKEMMSKGSD